MLQKGSVKEKKRTFAARHKPNDSFTDLISQHSVAAEKNKKWKK